VTTPILPAADPNVLSVTAGTKNGALASWANRSDTVDLVAPGASVVYFNGHAYLVTGTSTATAHVTGAAAGLAINRNKTPIQVSSDLGNLPGMAPPPKP
jgi:subtilisin family serine protease